MNKKLLIAAAVLMVVGCKSGKTTSNPGAATDPTTLPPAPMAVAPIDTAPVPVQNVSFDTGSKTATPNALGTKYVVQKGDTLWSIATKKYGDGKQFKKIQAANPSIKGETIMVGQTITLP